MAQGALMKPLDNVSRLPYTSHPTYFNLHIARERAWLERHAGLLAELSAIHNRNSQWHSVCVRTNNAACCTFFTHLLHDADLPCVASTSQKHDMLYILPDCTMPPFFHGTCAFILAPVEVDARPRFQRFLLAPTSQHEYEPAYALYVRLDLVDVFEAHFSYPGELQHGEGDAVLHFNNLVNLCIMVKDAGPLFREVLRENMRYADRWTVLDTGSTDGTLEIIRDELVGKHRGELHQEPFLNFRDSRNRCLDLAGRACKYNVMLDDTYIVRGDIRTFLETVRGDEFAASYSFYIQSDDTEYTTNRVTRSELNLRYKFKIHEVIQDKDNVNVIIPRDVAHIEDLRAEYMEARTMNRKQYDLQLLLESIEEEPEEPRHLYYTAQTYSLLEQYKLAAAYFERRANSELPGFYQERVDAAFELARTLQFQLNRPWSEVEPLYLRVLAMEPRRVDAMYFLGIYHVYDGRNNEDAAFPWFVKAFQLGYPTDTQYSLKPTLVFYFLPKFLAPMCYRRNEWQLGADACTRFLTHVHETYMHKVVNAADVELMTQWHHIYTQLLKLPLSLPVHTPRVEVVFVVDGNWSTWTGADIETKGLGGSETWAVEMASAVKTLLPSNNSVVLFCNCENPSVYRGVMYLPLATLHRFMAAHHVSVCIVSRFSHYTFVPLHTRCDQVMLWLHDLGPSGHILPLDARLTTVGCLSPWHAQLVSARFPSHAPRLTALGYGIDASVYAPTDKVRHSFIYSSFPDRGLVHLLHMWPRILDMWPDATLHVFCNLQHEHVRRVNGPMMAEIDKCLANQTGASQITVHGWVSKQQLASRMAATQYWLYPCIFDETFCHTALEAAAAGVIGVAPPKAALQHFPLLFVPGDAASTQWQSDALQALERVDADAASHAQAVQAGLTFAATSTWQQKARACINMFGK